MLRLSVGPAAIMIIVLFLSIIISNCNFSQGADDSSSYDTRLQLSVLTPPDGGYPEGSSWISPLASALLGQGTPGLFWGAVPADALESACQMIEGGYLTIPATATAYGKTFDWNLQIQATGGCDASSDSPVGAEIVFTDDTGVTNVIICDENAWSAGCGLYNTGEDVNSLYQQGISASTLASTDPSTSIPIVSNSTSGHGHLTPLSSNKGRHLMDNVSPLCIAEGGAVGAIFGVAGAILSCAFAEVPPMAAFCVPGAIGITAIAGVGARCASDAIASCVKGTAIVITQTGDHKQIRDINIGEKVGVWNNNLQKLEFSDVYGFGHADINASSIFLQVHLSRNHSLLGTLSKKIELTPLHFVLIHLEDNDQRVFYKYAKDIVLGEKMWIWDETFNQMFSYSITDIHSTIEEGLYNPFTLKGTILIDDVAISVHSEWFLDSLFYELGIAHWLPSTYQTLLVLPRLLYWLLGKDTYSRFYDFLDASLSIPLFGSKYGGGIFLTTFTLFTLGAFHLLNTFVFSILEKKCILENLRFVI